MSKTKMKTSAKRLMPGGYYNKLVEYDTVNNTMTVINANIRPQDIYIAESDGQFITEGCVVDYAAGDVLLVFGYGTNDTKMVVMDACTAAAYDIKQIVYDTEEARATRLASREQCLEPSTSIADSEA